MATRDALKTVDLASAAPVGRGESCLCAVSGCPESTSSGKPYCFHHVRSMPYIQKLVMELESREAEELRAASMGLRGIDLGGSRCTEILDRLAALGGQTLERLASEVGLTSRVARGYVRALANAGRVAIYRVTTARGKEKTIIGLSHAGTNVAAARTLKAAS